MKNSIPKLVVYLIASFIMIGCQEEVEIIITNPQFSVSYIQEIDNQGVELSANVYNLGSTSIEEYGFMYRREGTIPKLGNAEIVRILGKPEKSFTIKAKHSLERGRSYSVVAYMKTTAGYVYSEPVIFKSEGSEGFTFDRLEIPETSNFGDTLTVYANNLSSFIENYEIFLGGKNAEVTEISDSYFKFIIPNLPVLNADGLTYRFIFRIANKTFEASFPLNLPEPIIYTESINNYNYQDTVTIRGENLFSEFTFIRTNSGSRIYNLSVISKTDSTISFLLDGIFLRPDPLIEVTIRGKRFSDLRLFNINKTELDPDQEILSRFENGDSFEINGKNFNSNLIDAETILLNDEETDVFIQTKVPEATKLFLTSNMPLFGRTNTLSIESLGQRSQNQVTLIQSSPEIRAIQPNLNGLDFVNLQQNAKSFQGSRTRMLFTLDNTIYELNKTSNQIQKIIDTNLNFSQNGIFNVQHSDNIIYIGYYDSDLETPNFIRIDLNTNSITSLPPLPYRLQNPKRIYTTSNNLYLEGGFLLNDFGTPIESTNQRWRFDLNNETWLRLTDANFESNNVDQVNKFNNENISIEFLNSGIKIRKFDEINEEWILIKESPIPNTNYIDFLQTDQDFIIMNLRGIYILNKESSEFKEYNISSVQFQHLINNKSVFIDQTKFLYFHTDGYLGEFDYTYIDHP